MTYLLQWIKKEKWVFILSLLAIALTAFPFVYRSVGTAPSESNDAVFSEQSRLETSDQIQNLSKNILAHPEQYTTTILLTTVLFLIFILGIILNILYGIKHRSMQNAMRIHDLEHVPWTGFDLYKFCLYLYLTQNIFSLLFSIVWQLWPDAVGLNWVLIGSTIVSWLFVTSILTLYLKRKYGVSFFDLGLRLKKVIKQIGIGILYYIGIIPLYLAVILGMAKLLEHLQYQPPVQVPVQMLYSETDHGTLLWLALLMSFIAPFFEELFFRGFMYPVFRKKWGAFWGILVSSALFALVHGHFVAFLPIFGLGLALNWIYEKTGSIIPGFVMHVCHNSLMLLITLHIKDLIHG